MLSTTLARYTQLRPSVRALLFLFWIYAFSGSLIGVFAQLFLYQKFTDISLNIAATIVYYTGIMVGFCMPGYFAARLRLNIKQGFMWSFLLIALSILYFREIDSPMHAFIAMFFWGFGQGVYWLTVNTFELTETQDGERDFYSSVLNAGNQILGLAGPACATALIWLSGSVFHFGTYTLIFTVAPVIYLLGFFCFSRIRDYRPEPLEWADIKHFFKDRANQAAQLYTFGTGFRQMLSIVPPLVIFLVLGTALKVGAYNTILAILSALGILFVAQYRTSKNRLVIYALSMAGLALATAWLGYAFSLAALAIYTIADAILGPLEGVSSHVIDLSAMEIGRTGRDFYATMLLRDFFLWIWRACAGLIFLLVIAYAGNNRAALTLGMYFFAGGILLMYIGAFLFVKTRAAR